MNLKLNIELKKENFSLSGKLETNSPKVAIIGPSGAGKSTFLKFILGFEFSANGNFILNGKDLNHIPSWKRKIAYVPQNNLLFPLLTVKENLLMGNSNKNFDEVVDIFNIGHLLTKSSRLLSGGEKQRVALGRAILSHADLLLLDEPFSALDKFTKDKISKYLIQYCEEIKLPFILVAHDERDVSSLCEETWTIKNGLIQKTF